MMNIAKVVAFTAAIFFIASSCGDSSKSSTETSIQTIEPGSLKVCLYPGFAPFAIKGDDGTWSGWDVEFLEGFAKQQGLTLKPVEFSTFDNIWMRPGNDECDLDLQARIKKAGITNITLQYVDAGVDAAKQLLAGGSNAPIGFAEGVGSVQTLVQQFPSLGLAWQHCMMLPDGTISSEPFGFPVRAKSTGVAAALDSYIAQPTVAYPGGPGTGRDCPTGS
ncbi:MAG: transporter substrate-binding domain-containing protein [Actinobacteria bacterium]|nr:transporter substrate-binding domain-containing protein [Actinomycetota bacterium]